MELGNIINNGEISVDGVDFDIHGERFYHTPTPKEISINSSFLSLDVVTKESSLLDDMIVDNTYDVIIEFDNKSVDRIFIPNMNVKATLKVNKRIPRKMKKRLKQKYGDFWVGHHPNTSIEYTFEKQK